MQTKSTSHVLLILFRILFTILVLLTILFIFRNSFEIATVSSGRSHTFTSFLNRRLVQLGLSPLSEALVRKLAHFGEYTLLGFGYALCLRVYTQHYVRHISWPLFLGLGIACADETIQLYTAGRSSSLWDVWIDFTGCCVGVAGALILFLLLGGLLSLFGFGKQH